MKTIRQLREARGWTQHDLAERLGVDAGSISTWERGASRPRLKHLLGLAQLFGVSIDEIAVKQAPVQRRPSAP